MLNILIGLLLIYFSNTYGCIMFSITLKRVLFSTLAAYFVFAFPLISSSFCGFYVSQADTTIYNKASKVVIAKKDAKTVITMVNDFSGDAKEFAVVIPVPTLITKEQVHVTENQIIEHLDAYTAPRLVEYFDYNPCVPQRAVFLADRAAISQPSNNIAGLVKIEASYSVGEYDIVLLSASDSGALAQWLASNNYKLPKGAEKVLSSYIKQKMYFFLAKVNASEYDAGGYQYLRPLQVAFESEKFMLPVRLGTVNSQGDQELIIFTITSNGRVEPTNYRLIRMPTGKELPQSVRGNFAEVYKDIFHTQASREKKAIFLEYAWDTSWCDPCAADPLSAKELRELGAFWVAKPKAGDLMNMTKMAPLPVTDVFVTRMHARYNSETFPDDIMFHETADKNNFQARYIIRSAWSGHDECDELDKYRKSLGARYEEEARTLANLTGRDIKDVRAEINKHQGAVGEKKLKWYQEIWHAN